MPVLVDTSIWIQHFRIGVAEVPLMILAGEVRCHPVIVGELAVGGLPKRRQTMIKLRAIPQVPERVADDALDFIDQHNLFGLGLSWGDVQLLAAADLSGIPIWTFDQRLQQQASALNLSWTP
jgi:predicted nucleic acid-binding protein